MSKRGKKFLKIFSLVFLVVAVLFLLFEIPFIKGTDTTPPNATSITPANNAQTSNHAVFFSAILNDDMGISNAILKVYSSDGTLYATKSATYDRTNINFSQISAGSLHTCGLLIDGTALCWGNNGAGQLGDGTMADKNVPTPVSGGYHFSQISAGGGNTCGLLQNGSALCWGDNSNGQLGNGSNIDLTPGSNIGNIPTSVSGNYIFSQIFTGGYDTCGLLTNGSLLCWGNNQIGQLGNGSMGVDGNVPTPVSGNYNFSSIFVGSYNVCGLLANGSALCWGDDEYGQIGNGSVIINGGVSIPQPISGNYNFSSIAIGGDFTHMCGLLTNGSAMCWGSNYYGQLGDGTTISKYIPNPISGNYNFSLIAASDFSFTCGILINKSAMCWGYNHYGQLGDNTTINRLVPTFVNSTSSFSSFAEGYFHTCSLITDGTALCWGNNYWGQLGDNVTTEKHVPDLVYGNYTFSSIAAGEDHTCGVLTNKSLMCWGYDSTGQLGDNDTSDKNVPTLVLGNYNFSSVCGGFDYTCGILTNGSAMCWGGNTEGQLGDGTKIQKNISTPVSGNYNFSSITCGSFHTCGILINNSAMCWGINIYGQLGNGSKGGNKLAPTPVLGNYNFSQIDAGSTYTCGVLTNKSLMCWGDNYYSQLGDNTTIERHIPTPVLGNYNFSSVAVDIHTCGVLTNGTALCWGYNGNGQLGDNTTIQRNISTPVLGNYTFSSIAVRIYHTCGVLTNGTALCWGENYQGETGDGTTVEKHIPTPVSGNYNFSSITTGESHVCGILTNGTALCWGNNFDNQLGDNVITQMQIPTLVFNGIIFSNIINLLDGAYTWFMDIFDRSGNNYNTGNYTLTVYTGSVPTAGEQSGGSLPPSSSGNTVYVPAALNDNFWTETTIIPDSEWQQPAQPVLTNEQTPITESEAQTLEQQLIDELKTNPNAETQEITIKEITENISTGERVKVDVKNSSYYVGVANVSADSVIVQVSGGGGGAATQSLMKVGDTKEFDLNGDGLTDMKIEIINLEPSTKAGIKIEVVYNGLLNAKEIQQYNQNQKSNKLLIFAFIFIGVLIAITIYFRFRKYK